MPALDQSITIEQFTARAGAATIGVNDVPRRRTAMTRTRASRRCAPLLPCLAALTALSGSAGARAQSVTLSGIVDAAARQVSNDGFGSLKSLVSGSNSTSRLAFSGREDLGSGLAAGFHLEHGIALDSGAAASAAKFWDRRATISLFGKGFGELRLGRDFVPSYTAWSRHDPFAYVGVARTANFVSATPLGPIRSAFGTAPNTTVRSDNAVQWFLPGGLGGFEGNLMVAAGEGGAVASGLAKVIGGRVGWAGKAFSVTAAMTTSQNTQTTAAKFKDTSAGATLEVASVKLAAAWRRFDHDTAEQTLTLVAASTNFGATELKASWTRSDASGRVGTTAIGANDATQWGLGVVHNLSRRSALYATAAQISNKAASRYLMTDGPSNVSAGGSSRGLEFGVRHRF
jgi:predicted porin